MKGRMRASKTGELFPAAPATSATSVTAAPVAIAAPPVATPVAVSSGSPKHLWYAAVFADLTALDSLSRLQRFSVVAQRFTSFVSLEPPNALLLDIKGSVRLFGSLERLHARIDAAWQENGVRVQSATAPSTLAALWCARAGYQILVEDSALLAGRLHHLPIACTAWGPERLQTLKAMGVTYLGELLRLPRAGLARRLGPDAVLDLDIALARQPAPRRALVPRERFRERIDLETEIDQVAHLEPAVEALTRRCAQFLRERQVGVQALELKLWHRAGPVMRVRAGFAGVTGERRRLSDVLAQKLTQLELAAPVRAVELISGRLQPLTYAGHCDGAPQLVERLRARLGENAVYGVCVIAEHRPEAAYRRIYELRLAATPSRTAALNLAATLNLAAAVRDCDVQRPVWLLHEPEPLPYGALILEQGPERIESGWWDGKGVTRDYYIARRNRDHPGHGARLWVFQERRSNHWYVHGVFA